MNEKIKENEDREKDKPEEEIKTLTPVDQWMGLAHQLNLHKKMNLALSVVCGLQIMLIAMFAFQDPVVAVINEGQRVLLKASRQNLPVGEEEIKRVVKDFIKRRYQWDNLDPKLITSEIAPLSTRGFQKKTTSFLKDLKENGLQKKTASQKITDVAVTVTKDSILAHFDKVLRVEGIPLIIPTGLKVAVIKGAQTFWNPEGVYINGLLENASK